MTDLQKYQTLVEKTMQELEKDHIMERIWKRDHRVWNTKETEISNRLGWLDIAKRMQGEVGKIQEFVKEVQTDEFTHALLLGMGGSSLAPEVLRKTFGVKPGFLDLAVLDSTDPGAVLHFARELNARKTLYIVSTKSGGTVETFSFMRYFFNLLAEDIGSEDAGTHFIAITDPGSKLAEVAEEFHFRHIFLNDPNIGGRYSALSHFGLVPAALLGIELDRLLQNAVQMMSACGAETPTKKNPAELLGAAMGELAKQGRDKLTFVLSPSIASFGDWVEQLVAESTGKDGKGILPVVNEELLDVSTYAQDRVFFHLELEPELFHSQKIGELEAAGFPVIRVKINDLYELGGQFFAWELATAVTGHVLGIHPFDQPNVEAAKVLAREMVAAYKQDGKLPESGFQPADAQKLWDFLAGAESGRRYVSLQAYLMPSSETTSALQKLRCSIQSKYKVATTTGYGPRFLHSTGQLHKGDGGNGFFIQFLGTPPEDTLIPDEMGSAESSLSFGVLEAAQAGGDAQALVNNRRKLIQFRLGKDPAAEIRRLMP
jgi:glucose-6-phosphate isomerase